MREKCMEIMEYTLSSMLFSHVFLHYIYILVATRTSMDDENEDETTATKVAPAMRHIGAT